MIHWISWSCGLWLGPSPLAASAFHSNIQECFHFSFPRFDLSFLQSHLINGLLFLNMNEAEMKQDKRKNQWNQTLFEWNWKWKQWVCWKVGLFGGRSSQRKQRQLNKRSRKEWTQWMGSGMASGTKRFIFYGAVVGGANASFQRFLQFFINLFIPLSTLCLLFHFIPKIGQAKSWLNLYKPNNNRKLITKPIRPDASTKEKPINENLNNSSRWEGFLLIE